MSDKCKSSCGGNGMCPGVALLAAGLPAMLLYKLTGKEWVFLATTFILVPVLTLGLHKAFLPRLKKTELPSNES